MLLLAMILWDFDQPEVNIMHTRSVNFEIALNMVMEGLISLCI